MGGVEAAAEFLSWGRDRVEVEKSGSGNVGARMQAVASTIVACARFDVEVVVAGP